MRYSQVLTKLTGFVVLLLSAPSPARCQFTTIINVPPSSISQDTSFGPGTQANIFNGAMINRSLFVSGGELNVYGGRIENYLAAGDAGVVNVLGGFVSFAVIDDGGVLNMSNGLFDQLRVLPGGVVNMSGGSFEPPFGKLQLDTGAVLNLSGGTWSSGFTGGTVNVLGGEYRLDGVPISGLDAIGSKRVLHVPDGSILTGTLQDGTPFAGVGTLNLEVVALPDAVLPEIFASTDPVPTGVRNGQTLIVDNGGAVGDHFRAGWGSAVRVEAGGRMGRDFDALSNSIVNISGGAIGDYFFAAAGSEITITGGMIGHGFVASYGSAVNVRGGSIGREFTSGAQLHISGGSIGRVLHAAGATLLGADFRLDNVPIGGLNVVGDTQVIRLPAGALLSGTLSDGTPFAFCCNDEFNGDITLQLTDIPDATPIITVPSMPAPLGARMGQTVVVEAGGNLGANFNAGRGGALDVRQGGSVGDDLEAIGATINVNGGSVGKSARAYYGSTINIFGGSLGADFFASNSAINIRGGAVGSNSFANAGSVVNISGGSIGSNFTAQSDSEVNISGGSIGSSFRALDGSIVRISGGFIGSSFSAGNGSLVNISGGVISNGLQVRNSSVVNISGGVFGAAYQDFNASGNVNLFGREFYLDGERVDGLMIGQPLVFTERQGTLSGTFRDGSPFAFVLSSGSGRDFRGFSQFAVLTLTLVPEPSSATLLLVSVFTLAMRRKPLRS